MITIMARISAGSNAVHRSKHQLIGKRRRTERGGITAVTRLLGPSGACFDDDARVVIRPLAPHEPMDAGLSVARGELGFIHL
jgi:hypothetical protein